MIGGHTVLTVRPRRQTPTEGHAVGVLRPVQGHGCAGVVLDDLRDLLLRELETAPLTFHDGKPPWDPKAPSSFPTPHRRHSAHASSTLGPDRPSGESPPLLPKTWRQDPMLPNWPLPPLNIPLIRIR